MRNLAAAFAAGVVGNVPVGKNYDVRPGLLRTGPARARLQVAAINKKLGTATARRAPSKMPASWEGNHRICAKNLLVRVAASPAGPSALLPNAQQPRCHAVFPNGDPAAACAPGLRAAARKKVLQLKQQQFKEVPGAGSAAARLRKLCDALELPQWPGRPAVAV